jgi:hypothetical protein
LSPGKPVVLSTRTFVNRGEATTHFREMLNRYGPGDRVTDDDAADLASLLERHPDRDEKIGPGISHFEVQLADFNTRCFRVVKKDGAWARFSYYACISPAAVED